MFTRLEGCGALKSKTSLASSRSWNYHARLSFVSSLQLLGPRDPSVAYNTQTLPRSQAPFDRQVREHGNFRNSGQRILTTEYRFNVKAT